MRSAVYPYEGRLILMSELLAQIYIIVLGL